MARPVDREPAPPPTPADPAPRSKARLAAISAAVYLGFVCMALLLLVFNPIHMLDFEELDYGELPVAIVDGLVTAGNVPEFQTYSREGSMLFWSPAVAAVFALLGPSLFSLKLAGALIGGSWAVAWYWVSRLAFPRLAPGWVALAVVMPVPLIQLANLSVTSVMTHFGSSLWHGAALLALCVAVSGPAARSGRAALASGFAVGVGVYCSYSLIPLLPGMVWVALRARRRDLAGPWALGALPGLALAGAFLAPGALGGVATAETTGIYLDDLLRRTVTYGAGVYVGAERIAPDVNVFSSVAVVYPLLLATTAGLALARRWPAEPAAAAPPPWSRHLAEGLVLSVLGLLGALWVTGYRLDLWAFDGLRYLAPAAAPLTLLLLAAAARLPARVGRLAIGAFVASNSVCYLALMAPSRQAEYQHLTRGYHGSFFLHVSYDRPLLELDLPASRRGRYMLWMGAADALSGALDVHRARLDGSFSSPDEKAAYWRGVGLAGTVGSSCLETGNCVPDGVPPALAAVVWRGVGLSYDYDDRDELLPHVPAHARQDFLRGLRRRSFRDYDNWPRDEVFAPGVADRFVDLFGVVGGEAALRAHLDARPLPLFATPDLRRYVAALHSRARARVWWLESS